MVQNEDKFVGIIFFSYLCTLLYANMRIRERVHIILVALIGLWSMSGLAYAGSPIEHPVEYVAKDSLVLMGNGTAFLHGKGDVKYDKLELTSEYIRVKMDSSTVYARGVWTPYDKNDSTSRPGDGRGEWVGLPVFKDGNDSYESNEMTYNLKTQKGYIRHAVTEQGEGYIIADKTKKMEGNEMMMAGGQYTTCDDHDHPHFYLRMTKAKVVPGDYIATGPAYMVVGDVPLPLAIPFGFFPFTDKYSSGLIMPNYADDMERGLGLRGLGYYFAINDYVDLEVTGEIYTKGTWSVNARSNYRKRYKFNGNFSLSYRNDVRGEKDMPNYSAAKNFSVKWTHTQDSKANPYCNFSASVDFGTSGYNRSNINAYYNPNLTSQNTKSSRINYTQRFPDSPWSISATASITQRTKDSTMTLELPTLTWSMGTIHPFKRKKAVGKEKWFEKITLSYNGAGKIGVQNIKEDKILHSDFLRDWQTGLKHTANMSASFTVLKYLNISPTLSMNDRMYFQRINSLWDDDIQALHNDTTYGFYNVFDFRVGVSMSTKLYGFYTPIKKLFPKGKVEAFRHVLTPSIGFNYNPDFGKSFWKYYGEYDQPVYTGELDESGRKIQKVDDMGNPIFQHQVYSRFPNATYGTASRGASGSLNFSLQNNIEMKLRNEKDTTGKEPFKVYSLIDNFGISGGYNFIADSMNWNPFNLELRIKIPKVNYTINLRTSLDPYMYELNQLGRPVRTNKQYWSNGMFPRWSGVQMSFSYTFNNQVFRKWFGKDSKKKKNDSENANENGPDGNMDDMMMNEFGELNNAKRRGKGNNHTEPETEEGYTKTEIPWSLTLNYSIGCSEDKQNFDYEKMWYPMALRQTLSASGSIGLGQGWKVSTSTTFDFKAKKFSACTFNISRDLHCWNMTASVTPFGPFKNYTFHIGVNASMLADLKYDKNSTESTNRRVSWW